MAVAGSSIGPQACPFDDRVTWGSVLERLFLKPRQRDELADFEQQALLGAVSEIRDVTEGETLVHSGDPLHCSSVIRSLSTGTAVRSSV